MINLFVAAGAIPGRLWKCRPNQPGPWGCGLSSGRRCHGNQQPPSYLSWRQRRLVAHSPDVKTSGLTGLHFISISLYSLTDGSWRPRRVIFAPERAKLLARLSSVLNKPLDQRACSLETINIIKVGSRRWPAQIRAIHILL